MTSPGASPAPSHPERHYGLWGATGIGVGAIVGGGILALTGVAFSATGPSAMLAFFLNGILAFLTAASFAEVSTHFPQSGGPYVFAKKVLSIEAAFMVGWIVWFASVAAGALYAIGFASFAVIAARPVIESALGHAPADTFYRWLSLALAIGATLWYTLTLMRGTRGGAQWGNIGKVTVFCILIAGGVVYALWHGVTAYTSQLTPFMPSGVNGLIRAMGYTFIALQGFDLIVAVAGEVEAPQKRVPQAMFLSLGIALAIYIPLLAIMATVGVPAGATLADLAAESPDAMVAIGAQQYLGPVGYWLVVLAGIFAMLTALDANVLAASRMARAMALDRSLPHAFSRVSKKRGTPIAALLLTATLVVVVVSVVPSVEAAGAAASLIFLVSFGLVHWICILLRQRAIPKPGCFRTPLYPLVPALGGLGCFALAVFQGIAVPSAGAVAAVWLGVGVILFLILFARSARIVDAASSAADPEIVRLRGRSPLILVPIANPANAGGLVMMAHALTPPRAGRVLLLNVISVEDAPAGNAAEHALRDIHSVLRNALRVSMEHGIYPETLVCVAPDPWAEIARVARTHRCEGLLLGLGTLEGHAAQSQIGHLLATVDSSVVILRAQPGWNPGEAHRILVPLGGRGGHETLLARLLGSLRRTADRQVTFLRVMPEKTKDSEVRTAERMLRSTAHHLGESSAAIVVERSANALDCIVGYGENNDLVILGVERTSRQQKVFGNFAAAVAGGTACPLLVISRRS